MDVKHVWITANLTLKYSGYLNEGDVSLHLTVIDNDNIMDVINVAILEHLRLTGQGHEYLGFKIKSLLVDSIRDAITCRGCLDDLGNQEAHSCLGY